MSKNLSSLLKLTVAGAVLLSVGACKAGDKGQGALKSEGIAALNLSKADSSVFAKYFETKSCDVDEMEALGALAGLGLGESGSDGISYDSRDVTSGIVSYKNLTLVETGKDATSFTADEASFHCPEMGDDAPIYERLDLKNIFISNPSEGVEFTAETLNIAKPTAEAARSIIESLVSADSKATNNSDFDAISIKNAKIKSEDLNGTLKALIWGKTRPEAGSATTDFTVETANFVIPSKDGAEDMTIDFDGMSARNLNIGEKQDPALSANGVLGSVLGSLNVFEKPYDQFIVETLKVNSKAFAMNFGGIEGKTTEKSGVITTRQTLKPTVIELKEALGDDPSLARNYEILKSLNFETIKLSGSSVSTLNSKDDSITVTDGLFVIEDALRLNFEYDAEGLDAMTQKMKALEASNSSADPMAALESLKLRGFRLTLEDNSIVERGMKLATELTGQSESSIKLMLGSAVFFATAAAENEVQAEVYSETVEAFSNFVKKGGTLTIEANPPTPVALAPLLAGKGEDTDPEALGFSATQEGGAK